MVFSILHIIHSKSIGIPIIVIIYNIIVLIRIRISRIIYNPVHERSTF